MERQRLLGIQFARGVAALLVTFYHGSRMISLPQYAAHTGFGGFFSFGHAGVDFFFVLSGFIIYFVHNADIGRPERLSRYLWRRVTRIYPSYWLVLALLVSLLFARGDAALGAGHFLRSLLLLPDSQPPLLGVSWTLVHEMMFYAVFAIAILNLRLGLAVGAIWAIVVASRMLTDTAIPALAVAGALRNLQFAMGIAAAFGALYLPVRNGAALAAIGASCFFATGLAENAGWIEWDSGSGAMLFGFWAAVCILGTVIAERRGQLRFGRAAEFFGGTSYLLYLIHVVAIGLVYKALQAHSLITRVPDWISVTIAVFISVTLASALYRWFEQPVQSALRGIPWRRFALRGA